MLKMKNVERDIVECNPTPSSQVIPFIPQVETSRQSEQAVLNVSPELTEVATTVVQINPDPDKTKVPMSNLHSVGTPVSYTFWTSE